MADAAAAPTVPHAQDPFTGHKVPIYAGGDPPIELSMADSGERGDEVPPKTPPAETPPAKEPDPELPEAAVKKDDPDRDEQGRFVPKKRFDEVNERRRAAESRLAELEAEKKKTTEPAPAAYDFDAKEKQYIDLILDGKTGEAAALRREIRQAEQADFAQVATTKAAETNRAMSVEQQINTLVAGYEKNYPQFNPEAPEYSEELLDDINSFYTGALASKRFTNAAEAFDTSVQKAMRVHGIELKTAEPKPATDAPPLRSAAKRIDAIKNQPPNIGRVGAGGAEHGDANVRVAELSEKEFAMLPEATRRRLRGDAL